MKQFRNKNTGTVITRKEGMEAEYYTLFNFVTESEEWEEVKEDSYEVLSFIDVSGDSFDGRLLTKRENGGFHWENSDCDGQGTVEQYLKNSWYKIHSVKRLSDGEGYYRPKVNISENLFKIIATTDTSLKLQCSKCDDTKEIDTGMFGFVDCDRCYYKNDNKHLQLPQPSQQFIEKYIECYNKGEIITDVLVEYDYIFCEKKCINCPSVCLLGWKTKINPKDNTITIKKLKDSWNREEIKVLLRKALTHKDNEKIGSLITAKGEIREGNLRHWIEENL